MTQRRSVVVLSGSVGAGKSTLARGLAERYGAVILSTRALLEEHAGSAPDRLSLQRLGDRLDRETDHLWVVDAVARIGAAPLVVVDSARRTEQIDALRRAFPGAVVHIHLEAPLEELEARHRERRKERHDEPSSYRDVRRNLTERRVIELAGESDVVVDTARNRPVDVVIRVAARLGLGRGLDERMVDALVGGQFGSEGKGNIAAYLSPEYGLLVRSGGPNAGHSVMNPHGRHVQHHLPSGTTVSDARLLLSAGAVIRVESLLDEIAASGVEAGRLVVDRNSTIIDPSHPDDESRLRRAIGSTAQGVGLAMAARIANRGGGSTLASDVDELQPFLGDGVEVIEAAARAGDRIFVEGTQGSGLSLIYGMYPYVTSRDTNVSGILSEAGIAATRVRRVVMVIRSYPIRVANPARGSSGPLAAEISWKEVAERSGLDLDSLMKQEHTTTTRRLRRVGEFDWDLLRRSALLNRPTDIALTFVDQIDKRNIEARRFEQLTADTVQFIHEIEAVSGAPVTLISTRFHQRSVIDRRAW